MGKTWTRFLPSSRAQHTPLTHLPAHARRLPAPLPTMASFFANFDHFSKAQSHVQAKTTSGGLLSLIALAIMGMLFVSELVYWRTTRVEDHIVVDKSLGDRDVDIELELHFHALACRGA
jgi:hypothetical protein